jgi:hypothetical protein
MTNNVALYSLYAVSLKISFIESILVSPFGCFMKKNSEKIFPHSKSQKKTILLFFVQEALSTTWVYIFPLFTRRSSNIYMVCDI